MHDIIYDILSVFTASAIFAVIFMVLYAMEKKKYLLYWSLSWLMFAVVILLRIILHYNPDISTAQLSGLLMNLISSWLLLLGTLRFTQKKSRHMPNYLLSLAAAGVFISFLSGADHKVIRYFVFLFSSVIFIYSGITLYRHTRSFSIGGKIAGTALVIWGLHKADYPLVQDMQWFLPFGYQLAVILTLVTASGIILMHFEKTKADFAGKEDFFRSMAEASRDIVFFADLAPDLVLRYISPSVEKTTGYTPDEVMSEKTLQEMIVIDFLTKELGGVRKFTKPADAMNVHEIVTKSGKTVLLGFSYTTYYGIDGSLDRVIGYAKDVTGDVLDFETLVDRQDWYEALFQKSYSMQMLINAETGAVADANTTLTEFFGYSIDLFRSMSIGSLFASEEETEKFRNNSYKSEKPARYKMTDADGNIKDVLVSVSSIEFEKQTYLYLNLTDMSSEAYFEKQLNNISTLHSAILDSLNEGVAGLDEQGHIFFMNSFALDLLGYSYKEIVGKDHHTEIHYKNRDGEIKPVDCPIMHAVTDEKMITGYRDHFVKKDGSLIPVEIKLSPLRYFDNEKKCIIIFRDITQELSSESEMLRQIDENKVLLQEVHHRVKNNLQIISSLLSLQTSYLPDEQSVNPLQNSIARIKSMALIHELLYQTKDLSSFSLKQYLEKLVFDLSTMMASSDDIEIKTYIEDASISLDNAVPYGLIVTELLTNALKHAFTENPEKKIIEVGFRTENSGGCLWVRDSGKGFAGDPYSKNTFGITVVNSLAKQLGGELSYTSSDGLLVMLRVNNFTD